MFKSNRYFWVAIVLALFVCPMPIVTYAEVYKCKGPDGTMTFTDQPCPGTARAVVPASGTAPAPESASTGTTTPRKENSFVNPHNPNHHDDGKRCERGDKAACDRFIKGVERAWSDQCAQGDKGSCSAIYCRSTIFEKEAPASEFIACAESNNYLHGNYWAISDGRPSFHIPTNPGELAETIRKNGGFSYDHHLEMVCFREKASISMRRGSKLRIIERVTLSNSASGPSKDYAFSLDPGRSNDKPTEYRTIEELAAQHCKK